MTGTFTTLIPSEGQVLHFTGHGYAILQTGGYAHISNAEVLASYHFYAVIHYSITRFCTFGFSTKLVLSVTSTSSNDSVEFEVLVNDLPQGSRQAWRSPQTVALLSGEKYNLSLTYDSTVGGDNCSILVDSLVLIPDVNITRVYTESGREVQNQLQNCEQVSISRVGDEPGYCEELVFSASAEIYNGTLGKKKELCLQCL